MARDTRKDPKSTVADLPGRRSIFGYHETPDQKAPAPTSYGYEPPKDEKGTKNPWI